MPNEDKEKETETPYPFTCPFCDYNFRKERYLGRHMFSEHPDRVVNDGYDPMEEILDDWQ